MKQTSPVIEGYTIFRESDHLFGEREAAWMHGIQEAA